MPSASSGGPTANSVNNQTSHQPSSSRDSAPQYESVQVRQRGAWDFASYYESLCVLQDSCPISTVKAGLNVNTLDINADRIREEDWEPIFNAVKINKSLTFIAFRSYYDPEPDDMPTPRYPILKSSRKVPPIRKKELISKMCKALRQCLKVTASLAVLELQGLPLCYKDVEELSQGLHDNGSLTKLSLEFCNIGDESVEVLCLGLKQALTVSCLDLTCCNVSSVGAASLAKLVVYQSSLRHAEAWQDSLRYRRPNLDMLMGLRRIVLNANPLLGDEGASHFADALRDDLWLKALDLQKCGLTNDGAKCLLEVLKFSVTMVVCDVRKNPFIDKELIRSVTEQCLINCQGRDSEYPWMKIKSSENPDILKLRIKTQSAPTPKSSNGNSSARRPKKSKYAPRSKTARSDTENRGSNVVVPMGAGYPWRTALRVNRHKAMNAELHGAENKHNGLEYNRFRETTNKEKRKLNLVTGNVELSYDDYENEKHAYDQYSRPLSHSHAAPNFPAAHRTHSGAAYQREEKESSMEMRHVMVELEKMKMKLDRETETRRRCDQRLIDLEIENSRLRREIFAAKSGRSTSANLSEEQSIILDSVEETFKKFSKFLDLLRQAGFGDLADMAGLDSADLRKMSSAGVKKNGVDSEEPKNHEVDEMFQYRAPSTKSRTEKVGGQGDARQNKESINGNPDGKDENFQVNPNDKYESTNNVKYYPKTSEELMEEIKSITGTASPDKASSPENNNILEAVYSDNLRPKKREDFSHSYSHELNLEDILNENSNIDNSEMDDPTPSPLPISIVTDNEGGTGFRYD